MLNKVVTIISSMAIGNVTNLPKKDKLITYVVVLICLAVLIGISIKLM